VCGASRLILNEYSSKDRIKLYNDMYWINTVDDVARNSKDSIAGWIEKILLFSHVPVKNILDFGAGRGYFMSGATKLGFCCLGVDISSPNRLMVDPSAIAITNKLDIIPTSSLDAIIAIESFQHLIWPHYYMVEFSRILKPGGCALIITSLSDNNMSLIEDWFYVNPPYHSMLYTVQALKFIGDDCGMDMVWTDSKSITLFRAKEKNPEFMVYYNVIKNIDAI
jgi:SAM-dependent methyltransferase